MLVYAFAGLVLLPVVAGVCGWRPYGPSRETIEDAIVKHALLTAAIKYGHGCEVDFSYPRCAPTDLPGKRVLLLDQLASEAGIRVLHLDVAEQFLWPSEDYEILVVHYHALLRLSLDASFTVKQLCPSGTFSHSGELHFLRLNTGWRYVLARKGRDGSYSCFDG